MLLWNNKNCDCIKSSQLYIHIAFFYNIDFQSSFTVMKQQKNYASKLVSTVQL